MINGKSSGLSEIVSVIAITGVLAIAMIIVYVTFEQRQQDATYVIEDRLELGRLKANELLAPSDVFCNYDIMEFILHNYAKDIAIHKDETRFFKPDATEITISTWKDFDDNDIEYIKSGTSARIDISTDCDKNLILLTPAQEFLVITP